MKKSDISDKFSKFRKSVKANMNKIGIGGSKSKSKMKRFLNAILDSEITEQSQLDIDANISNIEIGNEVQNSTVNQFNLNDTVNSSLKMARRIYQ